MIKMVNPLENPLVEVFPVYLLLLSLLLMSISQAEYVDQPLWFGMLWQAQFSHFSFTPSHSFFFVVYGFVWQIKNRTTILIKKFMTMADIFGHKHSNLTNRNTTNKSCLVLYCWNISQHSVALAYCICIQMQNLHCRLANLFGLVGLDDKKKDIKYDKRT